MKINWKERTPQLIAVISVLVIIMAILIGFLVNRNSQMNEMQEQFEIDKQELEDEYPDLTPKQREYAAAKMYKTVGLLQIGGNLRFALVYLNGRVFRFRHECPLLGGIT